MPPAREICKRCWRISPVGFEVSDGLWESIVPDGLAAQVLCLFCFDEFATERGIAWEREVRLYPVSGATHRAFLSSQQSVLAT